MKIPYVSSVASFNSIDSWVNDVRRNNNTALLVLAGNKVDTDREVSYEKGKPRQIRLALCSLKPRLRVMPARRGCLR